MLRNGGHRSERSDGAIVSFTDHEARVAQIVRDASGTTIFAGETTADYDVITFLEDGTWRVRHWERAAATAAADPLPPDACAASVRLVREGSAGQFMVAGTSFAVAGVNYYPIRATHPGTSSGCSTARRSSTAT